MTLEAYQIFEIDILPFFLCLYMKRFSFLVDHNCKPRIIREFESVITAMNQRRLRKEREIAGLCWDSGSSSRDPGMEIETKREIPEIFPETKRQVLKKENLN